MQNLMNGAPLEEMKGMDLRDYFAAKALQGFCVGGTQGDALDSIAYLTYRMADAMMKARGE